MYYVKLVSWFVRGEKVKAVGEYLATFKKTRRADHHRLLLLAVENCARTYGSAGVTLPDLVACLRQKWALLLTHDTRPVLAPTFG